MTPSVLAVRLCDMSTNETPAHIESPLTTAERVQLLRLIDSMESAYTPEAYAQRLRDRQESRKAWAESDGDW